ncbi:hypothetical protein U2083_14375, partial [Listeria monocytogenes]|uniref:hypothetical protein n=1 Tax=Listeria monocytogenes TaxID=1639 RepID=UPI002FDC70B2
DSHGNETQISPLNEIQISSGQAIQVSGFELNGGSSVNIYALGLNKNFIYLGNTTSSSYLITKFPVSYSISPGFYNKKLS